MSTLSTSQSTFRRQPVPLQTVPRTEEVEALYHEDNSKGATDTYDPWHPPHPPPHPSIEALSTDQFNMQYSRQIIEFLAEVRGTNIIVPDRTPKLMPLQAVPRTEEVEAPYREDDSKGATEESPTDDPWEPPRPPPHPSIKALTSHHQFNMQYSRQIWNFLAEVRSTNIIVPDRTSEMTLRKFYEIHDRLEAILEKDSVLCFQRFFVKYLEHMVCGYVIIPQALNLIVAMNALQCAKFVLEGKSPKLGGLRANPNYITSHGFFPLHQAAESFSVDMVELLLHYGALANLRTSGNRIIEGLLPLHVAIENTCQHKYLEDNLLADKSYMKGNVKYIYKLIYLLCLPEMKIFLDTARLLATHTDKVVDELCDYIKHGKLVPAAILLLAAQKHIRNLNGFDTIMDLIDDSKFSLGREECGLESKRNSKAKKLKERKAHFDNALVLVKIILNAGEALDAYIQTHSKTSHEEVLGKVSEILQNYDVSPSAKIICIEDLDCCPYACPAPDGVLHKHGETSSTKAGETESSTLKVKAKKAVKKEPRKGQHLWYERDQFIPIWRSVLTCRFIVKMVPSYAPTKESPYNQHGGTRKKLNGQRPSQVRVGLLGSLGSKSWKLASDPKIASAYQSKRLFGTAALTVLKMLKRA